MVIEAIGLIEYHKENVFMNSCFVNAVVQKDYLGSLLKM